MDAQITIPASGSHTRSPLQPTRAGLRPAQVASVAILHFGLIAALALLYHATPLPTPPVDVSYPVAFEPAAPPPAEATSAVLDAATLQTPVTEQMAALEPLKQLVLPPGERDPVEQHPLRIVHRPSRRAAPEAAPSDLTNQPPSTQTQVRPAPAERPAAQAAAAPDPGLRIMASWEARIRQAVQDAAIYPASARLLHRDGRAEVRFEYDRGTVELASIAQSSRVDALDNAALAAVTHAAIPNPPAELGPQKRTMQVWVQFRLLQE